MKYVVTKSKLSGVINSSPSKSHSLRAILFAAMASGQSRITSYLHSPDIDAMMKACRMLGARIDLYDNKIVIEGNNGNVKTPDNIINAGNSGQVLRFITALLALNQNYSVITGDDSVRYNRPMQPLIDGLIGLGAFCISTKNDGYAPVIVQGPIKPKKTKLSGKDSQPVSALLIGSAFLKGKTEIYVKEPGEKPWIDLTLSYLDKIGVKYKNYNYEHYIIYGNASYDGFDYTIPGDFSSILFPVAAALITRSEITIKHVDMEDIQGDKKVIGALKKMGANIEYDDLNHLLKVKKTEQLTGKDIDVNDFIDAVPILAVVGCFAKGETKLKNASIARKKECDRLKAITTELRKMGAEIKELSDGLIIEPKKLHGCKVNTYHDHRIAMALSVAGMAATGETIVNDITSIRKSYPLFYEDMEKLGANIKVMS